MSASEPPLDTLLEVETPEGIELRADVAGPVPRALAYTLDLLLRSLILGALALLMIPVGGVGTGFYLVVSFLLEWFYPVAFEVFRNGETPGKRRFGLAVVNQDLSPVRIDASLVRNLLRAVDFLPFAYLGGLASMSASRCFQRLGDLAAGTLVVHRVRRPASVALPDARPAAPDAPLRVEDQLAIIDFTQRHKHLSDARQEELANILLPLTGAQGAAAVSRLRGIGNWLLGSR